MGEEREKREGEDMAKYLGRNLKSSVGSIKTIESFKKWSVVLNAFSSQVN